MITQDTEKVALNKRLENISWGLFLIMIGGIWLVPNHLVPEGAWLLGAGAIMLGLNAARYLNKIEPSNFTVLLGIVALLLGIGDFAGVDMPLIPIILILFGLNLLFKMVRPAANQEVTVTNQQ